MSIKSYITKENMYAAQTEELLKTLPLFVTHYSNDREGKLLPRSMHAYISDLHDFLRFIASILPDVPTVMDITPEILEKLTLDDFNMYFSQLRRNSMVCASNGKGDGALYYNANIARKIAVIRSFYKYLERSEKIKNNPALKIEGENAKRKNEKTPLRLTMDEIDNIKDNVEFGNTLTDRQKKFHDKSELRDIALITLLLHTGLRVSECAGLDLKDVNLETQSLQIVGKGAKIATVTFDDEAAAALAAYIEQRTHMEDVPTEHEAALFISRKHCRMTPRAIEMLVKKYIPEGIVDGKKLHTHSLRAAYAGILLDQTGNIDLVRARLRHSNVITTNLYAKTIDEKVDAIGKQGLNVSNQK